MTIKFTPNDKGNPPGKLADAELHFSGGPLDGLRLLSSSNGESGQRRIRSAGLRALQPTLVFWRLAPRRGSNRLRAVYTPRFPLTRLGRGFRFFSAAALAALLAMTTGAADEPSAVGRLVETIDGIHIEYSPGQEELARLLGERLAEGAGGVDADELGLDQHPAGRHLGDRQVHQLHVLVPQQPDRPGPQHHPLVPSLARLPHGPPP